ncbi:hypothetical protein C0J52_26001 [Blattella germanica]|nr:hypothetical protein C0J52_26001 [Blattella germanica]
MGVVMFSQFEYLVTFSWGRTGLPNACIETADNTMTEEPFLLSIRLISKHNKALVEFTLWSSPLLSRM